MHTSSVPSRHTTCYSVAKPSHAWSEHVISSMTFNSNMGPDRASYPENEKMPPSSPLLPAHPLADPPFIIDLPFGGHSTFAPLATRRVGATFTSPKNCSPTCENICAQGDIHTPT